jgi:type I restriction enzyme S subunit
MTFDLPEGWQLLSINDLAGIDGMVSDGDWIESKDQDPDGDVRLIQLADIGDGEFQNRSARFLTNNTARELRCTLLKAGDLLIARMPDPLGRACLFPGIGQPSITAVDVFIWRAGKNAAHPRWLMHAINSPRVRDHLQSIAVGSTRQRVSGGNIKRLELPTPPKPLQLRIAAKIDSLMARSKLARSELTHIAKLVTRYKQAVLKSAFQGLLTEAWRSSHDGLPRIAIDGDQQSTGVRRRKQRGASSDAFEPPFEIPSQWVWARLPLLGVLDRGRSRHRPRNHPMLYGGPYPFIQTGDVKAADGLLTSYSQTYSEKGLAQSRLWPKGTLCITIAANIADTAILGIDACFPDSIVGFTADVSLCSPTLIEYFIRTVQADLAAFAPATAQKNINLETLGMVHVPCAPLEEQAEIERQIQLAFARIDQIASEAESANRLLVRLNQSILEKAFRGELIAQHLEEKLSHKAAAE